MTRVLVSSRQPLSKHVNSKKYQVNNIFLRTTKYHMFLILISRPCRKMKGLILALVLFFSGVDCRFSVQERQWNADDARQNVTDDCFNKCNKTCEYCKVTETCTEYEVKCGEEPPEVGPDCPANEICIPAGCECRSSRILL